MILNFNFSNYNCIYRAGNHKIHGVCFSSGYVGGVYNGRVYITYFLAKQRDELNYVFLSRKQVIDYVCEVSQLLGFDLIALKETESYYKLQVAMPKDRRLFLYISTFIRYTYEHPFSLALYCAILNRHNFPELNIIQIIQFYIGLFFNGRSCHIIADTGLCFSNMNCKSQFNILRYHFNSSNSFIKLDINHGTMLGFFDVINTKQLPQIAEGINNIANKYYAKYKKSICCW